MAENSVRGPADRPNVVWICADDFTPDVCGAYGNRVVRTPNLDRLAARGLRFDRAFCTCPLSTPSRQSFWTGRYPRSIGVTLSPTPLPDDEVTLPAMLRRAGYEVAALGKTHYYLPRPHEFDTRVDFAEYELLNPGAVQAALPRGQVLGEWRPFEDPAAVWLNSAGLPYPAFDRDMFGTFLATLAGRFLEARRARPFFLYVSFYETHSPFWFPVEYRGRHHPRDFPAPPVTADEAGRLPPVFRELTEADRRGIRAAYATSAEFMDKNVGLVLDALDRTPHADNTLVIFTSDHGYLLGQHGRFEKHCCYDPAVRAALMMRHPRIANPGRGTAALVELIDVLPTVLEFCGVTPPAHLHGRSLAPLLRDETASHRGFVVAEYADNEEGMVRTDRWKLIYGTGGRRRRDGYATGEPTGVPATQLYDLEADPDELTNLAARPDQAGRVAELTGVLIDHLRRTAREPEALPDPADRTRFLARALAPADVGLTEYLRRKARP
jgi:arylsulfatase A-like enzyme